MSVCILHTFYIVFYIVFCAHVNFLLDLFKKKKKKHTQITHLSFGQKRRSNRVVKRKKYTEDLDIKITDDEDEQEDVDVTTTAAAVASISGGTAAQLKQEMELDVDGQPSMQFFVVSVRTIVTKLFLLWSD